MNCSAEMISETDVISSIFVPGRNCCKVARARRAALLVDGDAYFKAFMQAAQRATRSIIILAWDFNSRTRLHFDEVERGPPAIVGDFLNYLVKRRRGLRIYVLDWDYPMVFGTDREFPPLFGLGWTPRRHVYLRYDNTHPVAGSHHQKIVVIDDAIAFSGGLDLTCRRWDTPEHRPGDPRRIADGAAYPPFHDLMAAVDGEAAKVLAGIARERWRRATGKELAPVAVKTDPWPVELQPDLTDVEVGISCTSPPTQQQPAVRDVEALYLDMIARARRYIYTENQYFTANKVGEAIEARLAEPDGPEIVLVLRLLSHGWLEEHTMEVLRTRLINKLRAADRHNRFHVYYPHASGLKKGTCIDVHSKVMVVDDEWLRIGSANLSNRSMGMDTECDLTFEAHGQHRVATVIRGFRDRLLAEHLGVSEEQVGKEIERAGSMSGAIGSLQSEERTLKALGELPQWSDTVISLAEAADLERPVSLQNLIDEFSPDMDIQSSRPAWGKFMLAALVLFVLAAAWRFTPLAELVTADRITGWAREFAGRPWAPLIVLAAYTPASLVMFPRPLITLFAVVAFGPWLGFGYAISGILIAALATYFAGLMLERATVRKLAGSNLNRISQALRKRGLLAVTALRLVPLAPFAVEGVVAGAIRIKLWHFALGTVLGMLPGTLATTVFGDQLEAALRDPAEINYWLVGIIAVVLIVGTLAVRKWLFKTQLQEHHTHAA